MGKKIAILIVVAIIGIIISVSIVGKQARDPVLREIMDQQTKILRSQEALQDQLSLNRETASVLLGVTSPSDDAGTNALLKNQQALEKRIIDLESEWKDFKKTLKLAKDTTRPTPPPRPTEDLSKVYEIDVAHSYVRGDSDAPVMVVEFVDFQCPYCAKFHPPLVEALNSYLPKKVRYMVKNFPLSFHPRAKPGSKAAFAAGEQGKYFEMVDALLENGKSLNEEKFEELAKNLGLDVKKFKKDFKDKDEQWEEYILADIDLGRQVDVRGTPTFYIGGRKSNARDVEGFKKEIDQALEGK